MAYAKHAGATAHGLEVDFGRAVTGSPETVGILLIAQADEQAGASGNNDYMRIGASSSVASPENGLSFVGSGVSPLTGALILVDRDLECVDGINLSEGNFSGFALRIRFLGIKDTGELQWASSQDPASPDVGLKREVIESNTALKVTNSTTGYGRLHCEELRAHGSIYTGAEAIEVNHYGTGNRNALVDFHADDTHADYSARLIRAAGVDPDLSLTNVGNGSLRLGTVGSDRLTINSAGSVMIGTATDGMTSGGSLAITHDIAHPGAKAGFFNTSPVTKPTVTGSRGGNAALASLLTALAGLGLLVDSST